MALQLGFGFLRIGSPGACWDGDYEEEFDNVELSPEQLAFSQCTAGADDIINGRWDLTPALGPRGAKEDVFYNEDDVNCCFEGLEWALQAYQLGLPKPPLVPLEKVPLRAKELAQLCGFHRSKGFEALSLTDDFKLGGQDVGYKQYAICREARGQLLLLWEECLSGEQKREIEEGTGAAHLENSVAHIIGDMIAVHYTNLCKRKYEPAEVYALRMIDDKFAVFRMNMTADQIEALCNDGVIPSPKLQVCRRCHAPAHNFCRYSTFHETRCCREESTE